MARVSEDHVMIQYELWTRLVLSCNNVIQFLCKFLVHELADMENWWKVVNKDGHVLKSMTLIRWSLHSSNYSYE